MTYQEPKGWVGTGANEVLPLVHDKRYKKLVEAAKEVLAHVWIFLPLNQGDDRVLNLTEPQYNHLQKSVAGLYAMKEALAQLGEKVKL